MDVDERVIIVNFKVCERWTQVFADVLYAKNKERFDYRQTWIDIKSFGLENQNITEETSNICLRT